MIPVSASLRRSVTIPLHLGLAAVLPLLLAVILPILAAIDLWRGSNWSLARAALFFAVYVTCEAAGIVAAGGLWAIAKLMPGFDDASYLRANFNLQCAWASTLYRFAEKIFSIETEVRGADAVARGPFLLFSRHVSTGDTVLPAVFVSKAHSIVLRYVLKRELLWDPCLDIVGNRLRNYFVDRESDRREGEIEKVAALADGLGCDEGVLIYPEGTRFTPAKQRRALDKLAKGTEPALLRIASRMRHVLPPRLGGPIALLQRNRGIDLVLCAHVGFEGIEGLGDLFDGSLIGRAVRVQFRRIARSEIPTDPAVLRRWLFEQWLALDELVGEMRGPAGAPAAADALGRCAS